MEINGQFFVVPINSVDMYVCRVVKASITEEDQVIKEFKGVHVEGKNNDDVKIVCFYQTKVNYFPRGLEKHFPNLTQLVFRGCGLEKISKNDLKGLEGLCLLSVENSQLTSLPDDLFTEMPNLREVLFCHNEIEFASSNLLKPLIGRENVRVSLQRNKSIDALLASGFRGSLKSLEELMKLIDEKCSKPVLPIVVSDLVDFYPNLKSDPVDFIPKIKDLWVSGRFSDLTIIAGEKKFKVHKAVLGMGSEVFAQMFEDQSEATEIRIPGFSSNSVEALLKFIYTNEISDGNAKEIFEIADKFKVPEMKSIYEKIIFNQLDDSIASEIFLFAHRHSSQLLMEKASRLTAARIAEKFPELSANFLKEPENLKKLIEARRDLGKILTDK